jgi:hypothetical protein
VLPRGSMRPVGPEPALGCVALRAPGQVRLAHESTRPPSRPAVGWASMVGTTSTGLARRAGTAAFCDGACNRAGRGWRSRRTCIRRIAGRAPSATRDLRSDSRGFRAVRCSVCMTAATKPGHSVCADLVAAFSEEELSDAGGRDDCVSGRAAVDRGAGKTAAGVWRLVDAANRP